MRDRSASLLALLLCASPHLLSAQTSSSLTPGEAPVVTATQGILAVPDNSVTASLQRWQLLIRHGFSSRVEEQRPATLTYETAGKHRNNYRIDLAAGHDFKNGNFNLTPSVEWHRRSLDTVDRNRISAAVTTDWTTKMAAFTPLVRGRAEVGRDVAIGITTSTASLLLSGFVPHGEDTGSSLQFHDLYKGTFYPYAGVEYFHNQPVGDLAIESATMLVAIVEAKVVPLNHAKRGIDSALEINGSYAFRKPLDNGALRSRYQLLKLDLNLYLDAMHHVAFGFEYQSGQDPDAHLVSGHAGLVALKFKL
jgi:hypothetical protein